MARTPQTRLIHEGSQRSHYGETAEPIYLTSGFVYDSAEQAEARFRGDEGEQGKFIYSRYGNPSIQVFEERLRLLEGAQACVATGSGMSAMAASLLCYLRAGDHVVASTVLFSSCLQILQTYLPRFGIDVTLVDGADLKAWEAAIRPGKTKVFFCETPANPTLALVDIAAVANIAHGVAALMIVDNAFACPIVQKPLDLGADVVTYSATKHMDGQGRCMGGAVLCAEEFYRDHLQPYHRHMGPHMSPFNAWSLAKSLETLDLRVTRMCENALQIAQTPEKSPRIRRVLYPGLKSHPQYDLAQRQMQSGGSLLAFEVEGGKQEAFALLNHLKLILISNNLGDSKSLATHPATTTHQTLGEDGRAAAHISDALIRLSVGLENSEDLIADLLTACRF